MKKLNFKIVAICLITILSLCTMTTKVFAENENIQIVKSGEDYIIYVKEMADKEFKFATSDGDEPLEVTSTQLNYVNSVKDDEGSGNNVALLHDEAKYLYIKEGTNSSTIKLDFTDAIDKTKIEEVESITNRIAASETTINQRDEQIEQVKYEETIGGLQIEDDKDATYEFATAKLSDEKYANLKKLIDELNSDYSSKDIYSKIEFVKELSKVFDEIKETANWESVKDMRVIQPSDAADKEEYVVLLKQTKGTEVKYDAKFLTSKKSEEAPIEKEETTVVKRTAKLPITGDSLILFGILAVIVIALIIVFVRMKKIQNKGRN